MSRGPSASNKDRKTRRSGKNGKKRRSRLKNLFPRRAVRPRPLGKPQTGHSPSELFLRQKKLFYIPSYWLKDERKMINKCFFVQKPTILVQNNFRPKIAMLSQYWEDSPSNSLCSVLSDTYRPKKLPLAFFSFIARSHVPSHLHSPSVYPKINKKLLGRLCHRGPFLRSLRWAVLGELREGFYDRIGGQ